MDVNYFHKKALSYMFDRIPMTKSWVPYCPSNSLQLCPKLMIKALEKYINTLTLSWWRSLSYSNQSTDLLCKSMDCFLYDRDLRHERANVLSSFQHVNWDKFLTNYFLPELFSSAISPLIVLPFCTKIKKKKRSYSEHTEVF